MLRIVLVTPLPESIHSFAEALDSDPEVRLHRVGSGLEALNIARTLSPHLVIIDNDLPDIKPLALVQKLLMANAMVNTALMSPLTEEDFHEASEGLGVLARLPVNPTQNDAEGLVHKLRSVLGITP